MDVSPYSGQLRNIMQIPQVVIECRANSVCLGDCTALAEPRRSFEHPRESERYQKGRVQMSRVTR